MHKRKEEFVFVIHPNKEYKAANKEDRTVRQRGEPMQCENGEGAFNVKWLWIILVVWSVWWWAIWPASQKTFPMPDLEDKDCFSF